MLYLFDYGAGFAVSVVNRSELHCMRSCERINVTHEREREEEREREREREREKGREGER